MRKVIFITSLCSLFISFTHCTLAQRKLTLEDALKTAIENRIELKNQQVEVQLSQLENDKLRARWRPQLNGSADLRWNTQIQTSVIKDANFVPGGGDAIIKLGVPFNNTLTINAEQKVFDAQKKIERQINQTAVQQKEVTLEKIKTDLRLAVTEAYFGALWAKEKRTLSNQGIARAKTYLATAEEQLAKGTVLLNDVKKLRLDLSNAEFTHRKDQQDYLLALQNLAYQMGESIENQGIELAESLTQFTGLTTVVESNSANRVEIKTELLGLRTNELTAQKQRASFLPTLSAYGTYGTLQFNDIPNPFATNTWFNYNFVGLRLSAPIYNGGQTRANQQEYLLRAKLNKNNAEKLKRDFDYETVSTRNTYQQAIENLTQSQENVALAKQILATDQARFDKGTLLWEALKNSEYSLQTAENNYLRVVYDTLIARIRYQKAAGVL
jgi:outer membrane protein